MDQIGPWIGGIGGILAVVGYLTLVTQVKTKLDMFIIEQRTFRTEVKVDQRTFRAEVNEDFEKLGDRLETAIRDLHDNDLTTQEHEIRLGIVEDRLGVDHGKKEAVSES